MPTSEDAAGRIRAMVAESRAAILAHLRELVECNSYTHNKKGVDRVGELLARQMPKGFAHEVIENNELGNHHLFRRVDGKEGVLPVILVGHTDTVFPSESPFRNFALEGEKITGPGTADMKGGLAVIVWALKILERCEALECLSILCVFNSDEEIGSPSSRRIFAALEGRAAAALVFECGGEGGRLVAERRGITRFELTVSGRGGHAGGLGRPKASAVLEAAHQILALEALNHPDASLLVNVGKVHGGTAANVVAAEAVLAGELRYWEQSVGDEGFRAAARIAESPTVAGTTCRLAATTSRPPMRRAPGWERLFEAAKATATLLGQRLELERRNGVSDANLLAAAGIPTLDGLGPVGFDDHSEGEYILAESLFARVELTANLLLRLSGPP